jgi:hypothetical protein
MIVASTNLHSLLQPMQAKILHHQQLSLLPKVQTVPVNILATHLPQDVKDAINFMPTYKFKILAEKLEHFI